MNRVTTETINDLLGKKITVEYKDEKDRYDYLCIAFDTGFVKLIPLKDKIPDYTSGFWMDIDGIKSIREIKEEVKEEEA